MASKKSSESTPRSVTSGDKLPLSWVLNQERLNQLKRTIIETIAVSQLYSDDGLRMPGAFLVPAGTPSHGRD